MTQDVHIVADARERGKIVKALEALPGVTLETRELDCGDYVLGDGVVVERKSATDFILSIVDKSLPEKVGKLKAQYARPVYIVEGDLFNMRFHQKAFDVHGALAYLGVSQRVPVVSSPDADQSAMLIYLMAAEAQAAPHTRARLNTPEVLHEAQRYALEGFPGIDADRADTLLAHFGSVAAVLNASAEALIEAGLDPDPAAALREVVEARWPGSGGQ